MILKSLTFSILEKMNCLNSKHVILVPVGSSRSIVFMVVVVATAVFDTQSGWIFLVYGDLN